MVGSLGRNRYTLAAIQCQVAIASRQAGIRASLAIFITIGSASSVHNSLRQTGSRRTWRPMQVVANAELVVQLDELWCSKVPMGTRVASAAS